MATRLFLTAAILLGMYGGVVWVRDRGMPMEPAPLEMKPQDLPMTLGNWRGEAVELDPQVFRHTGALMAMDRLYRDQRGRAVALHLAVFDVASGLQGLPHQPEVCYSSGGWLIGDPKIVSLDQPDASGDLARFWPAARNGQTGYVLYWYQVQGAAYCTGDSQRQLLLAQRGRSTRPPVVKVLMQTSAASPEQGEQTLMSLAAEIFAWTRDYR